MKTAAPDRNPHLGRKLSDGTVVVNERCRCRALRTEHGGLIGHGPYEPNDCAKFTWAEFVAVPAPMPGQDAKVRS